MKNSLIKSALVAVAAIAAGSAFAATSTNQIFGVTFEGTAVQYENDNEYVAGEGVTNYTGWAASADSDQSTITTEEVAAGQQALKLSTEGTELTREISSDTASAIASAIEDGSAVFESKVKFVATDTLLTGLPEGIDNTKFAIYAYSAGDGSPTNLVVYHKWQDYADGDAVDSYTNEITSAVIDTEDFTTISVELKKYTSDRKAAMAFQVSVNGQVITSALPFSDSIVDGETFETIATYPLGNTFMETVNGASNTDKEFSEIAFKGTGYVDDIAIKTVATIVETTYTAKFVDGKNNMTNTVSDITAGDTVAAPETDPSFTGFTFEGWALEDTTTEVTFPYTVNADVTFVALWSENATPGYAENDTVNGETITAAQATWLNAFIGEGEQQYADKAAFEAALANKTSELTIADSYLLGVNPISGGAVFTVTGIAVDDANGTVDITVSLDRSGAVNDSINGTLKVKGYATLGGSATAFDQTVSAADFIGGDLTKTYTVTPENDEVFFKAAVE